MQQLKEGPCTSECLSPSGTTSAREEASGRQSSESGTAGDGKAEVSSQADGLHEGVAGLLAMNSTADSKALLKVWPALVCNVVLDILVSACQMWQVYSGQALDVLAGDNAQHCVSACSTSSALAS